MADSLMRYTNLKTKFVLTGQEVNEALSILIIFCSINNNSRQASRLKKKLLKFEKSVNKGHFKN